MSEWMKRLIEKNKGTTVEIQMDRHGEHYIEIPNEWFEKLGLETGDTLVWIQTGEQSWSVQKKST